MQESELRTSRVRRSLNDLVLAEMFLVQATIESATVISEGFSELGRRVTNPAADEASPWDSMRLVLRRTADEALEPYSSRFKFLQEMIASDR